MRIARSIRLIAFIVFIGVALLTGGRSLLKTRFLYGDAGALDFVQYWSAHRLLTSGENPYHPSALLAVEQSVGFSDSQPLMMWVPPWTLFFMRPIIGFEFQTSAMLWFFCNLLLFLGSLVLLWKFFERPLPLADFFIAAAVFAPVWSTVALGQTSMLLLFGGTLLLYGQRKRSVYLLALGLALISIKPYLFHLPLLFLLFESLRRRELLVWRAAAHAVALLSLGLLFYPLESLGFWLDAISSSNSVQGAVAPRSWIPATLVGPLRCLFKGEPLLISAELFLSADVLLLLYLMKKGIPKGNLFLPALFILSYLSSPYGWLFDQSMLLPAHLAGFAVAAKLRSNEETVANVLLCSLQVAAQLFMQFFAKWHHEAFWIPLAFLVVFYCVCSKRGGRREDFAV